MAQAQLSEGDVDFLLEMFREQPDAFIRDVLGAAPWELQVAIIKSVFKYKLTAVKTCNAVGKSFIAARIVVAFLMLYPSSIVVTTAPTWRQVTDVLWREIGTAVKQAKYKLTEAEVTQAGLNLDTDWYAVGLSTKRPENFFGYHADHILVVVDEAGGVEEPIFKGVAAITPNANARVLLIGNPTSPTGSFFDAFNKPELGYNCFTISAFDTPNFTDSGITNVETLLEKFTPPAGVSQAEWTAKVNQEIETRTRAAYRGLIAPSVVYGRFHEWGTDSPAWQSLIMGEFPSQAEQALIPTDIVSMAMNMYGIDEASGKTYAEVSGWNIPEGPQEYGLDMARYGSDSTVLTPRRGGWVEAQVSWNKVDLMESADRIINLVDPLDPNLRINIDDTGNGGGTTDRLRQLSNQSMTSGLPAYQFRIQPYNFSSAPRNPKKFHDITSELYWNLREWFMKKQIALPHDKQLFDELVGRRWGITPTGKIKVESKDDYRKRTGGKSPDRADSLALAFAGGIREHISEPEPHLQPTAQDLAPITSGLLERY